MVDFYITHDRYFKRLFSIVYFLFSFVGIYGQSLNSITIDTSSNGTGSKDYLSQIEKKYNVDFIFEEDRMGNFGLNGITQERNMIEYLKIYFDAFGLQVIVVQHNVALIVPDEIADRIDKNGYHLIKPALGDKVILKGEIFDIDLNEPLIGAQIVIESMNKGGITNLEGEFSIQYNTSEKYHIIRNQYNGFDSKTQLIAYSPYGKKKLPRTSLYPAVTELEDVIIQANSLDKNISEKLTGVENMGIESINALPTFMGEVDLVNGLKTLPGVSTVGELSSGFNVRGGNIGQNLIRQDGAIIYNPSHLFGFYSAFNPDIVDDVTLIKGGGNARYGSRVSSIMDVSLRNGKTREYHVNGGIGMAASRLLIEGPVVKNKSSFILGGRISYADWVLDLTKDIKLSQSSANFGDLTGKFFQKINKDNYLSISTYGSYDSFSLASDSVFSWHNRNAALKWGHNFNSITGSQLTVSVSSYGTKLDNKDEIEGFNYKNGVLSTNLIYNVESEFSESKSVNYGIEANYSNINPGQSRNITEFSNNLEFNLDNHKTLETALFGQFDTDINNQLAFSAGLRYSQFYRFGEGTVYTYEYNLLDSQFPERKDTLNYNAGELIEFQHGFEPRISIRYKMDPTMSIKASYYKTYQYIHLISNTTSPSPLDYWLTGGPNLEPEIGDQITLGIFKNFSDNIYEVSTEAYYKNVKNTIDYIEGAEVKLSESIEGNLIQGKGIAYGIEVLARKNVGQVNGWLSYTFSRSMLEFNSAYDVLTLNEGKLYPSQYDQPHNLSVVLNYQAGKIITLSANFSYATGRPITIPVSKYSYAGYPTVNSFSQRNEFRVTDYRRLDISATLRGEHPEKRFQGEWVLSIFNVLGRNNVYAVTFDQYGRAKKVSVIGNMFPSLTYNFKF